MLATTNDSDIIIFPQLGLVVIREGQPTWPGCLHGRAVHTVGRHLYEQEERPMNENNYKFYHKINPNKKI